MSGYNHDVANNITNTLTSNTSQDIQFYVDKWLTQGFSIVQIKNITKCSPNLQEADRIFQNMRTPASYNVDIDY